MEYYATIGYTPMEHILLCRLSYLTNKSAISVSLRVYKPLCFLPL